ncbi:MAG: maleylacetoacetate isomerase [Rhodobacterales bacterium]|nr:maleylacetoacetate isomerase [Rhodobacterales bacterium]
MKFYGYFRSSSAYRCRIAFNIKGLGCDFESVHLKSGAQKSTEYAALNPQKLVPTLVTNGGLELTQSLAIIEWLDETYPEVSLLPDDIDLRAQVRAFAQIIACEIHPLQNLRVLKYIGANLNAGSDETSAWLGHWLYEGLAACEAILQKNGRDTAFCFGDAPGLADLCLAPQIFSATRFGVDISALTRINDINAACAALPEFRNAEPARQPDYEE